MLESFTAFSPTAGDIVGRFFEREWIDAATRPGKMLGAFCATLVPDVHPYVLMNYAGERRSILTLAHELGHGLHGTLAQDLGLLNARTPLTLAETASVFGEALTFEKLMEREDDPRARLDLLVGRIDDTIATVFRQVALNRFEHAIHTGRREEGELPVERISELWRAEQERMLGDSVEVTDDYGIWWSYVPHFIQAPGYVYAYSFGYLFSLAIYRRYLDEGEALVEPYLDLLRAGGSAPPAELASRLGFDIGDPGFWSAGLDAIGVLVDEAEQLAAQLDGVVLLVVAATERELAPVEGARRVVCGIGPVEAAVATARALAEERPSAVLHVGIAGARGLEPLQLVLGSEAVYCDAAGPLVPALALPDADLLARLHQAFPDAVLRPIGTSARVGGSHEIDVEAMEGFAVLRACELAGVPAVEVRVVSNEIDEPDRALWRFDDAFALLAETLPRLVAVASARVSRPATASSRSRRRFRPRPAPSASSSPSRSGSTGDGLWIALRLGMPRRDRDQMLAVRATTRSCGPGARGRRPADGRWRSPGLGHRRRGQSATPDVAFARVVVGALVFAPGGLPLSPLRAPAVAWLALVGLVVPVLIIEDAPARTPRSAARSSWRAPTTSTRSARSRRS